MEWEDISTGMITGRNRVLYNKRFVMIKKHKDSIRNDGSYVASVSRMSRVTPWFGFPDFGGFTFDEFCTADVFYASDDDLL
jgi:hypothetical protein